MVWPRRITVVPEAVHGNGGRAGVTATALELVGILVACGAAAAALVIVDRRARTAAMAAALVVAPVLVLGDVWDEPTGRRPPRQPGAGRRGARRLGARPGASLVAAFRRCPGVPVAAIALLPLRVPIEIGGETANLLVPLYLVIAAGRDRPAAP